MPSPGNTAGGLTTILEKSLGAVAKGGTSNLQAVYEYAEPVKDHGFVYRADQLGCQYIATGHYANIRKDAETGRFVVSKGLDENKDQSYALWGVSQESLSRTLFPLGGMRKTEIYDEARRRGFIELVNKPESYEICFIPDNDYRGFLRRRVPGLEARVAGGNFVTKNGRVIGKHEGYPFYTIGQRKGLGVA